MSFFSTRRLLACVLPALWAVPVHAQEPELTPLDPAPVTLDDKISAATQSALAKGQLLLDQNDPGAVPVLRDASQSALKALGEATGGNALTLASFPGDTVTQQLAISAIAAHALWGRAADQFGRRDEAITALVRAKTLLAATRVQPDAILVRDLNVELNALLRNGLPLVAPDDVLDGIAGRVHENLWKARRFNFTPAWLLDRMSILQLKLYHFEEQTNRLDVSNDHQQKARQKLAVLREQEADLAHCFDELLDDIRNGDRYMKVYRQMKMYNDPTLNPILYKNDKG